MMHVMSSSVLDNQLPYCKQCFLHIAHIYALMQWSLISSL